ncbi:DNA mismatch repair protein Mlh1 [Diachasmimorpha longicaudata]|uniref:DNA mismatch repair protein Mlh1 n=1 Tax=Diachasmimorpha longicaudata TaxID=58733 RepID=UPI0030B8BE58
MGTPGKIQKLDEVVVNRIAAGEVIQRPANALKELIENSLDAKSTNIQITVKDGGLKSLQIQDNGTGIRKEDLAIVCERFTTSKLKKFDDLKSISTFGFRGEALASMSHVAHLTITTKTIEDKVAYKASYLDGKLKGPPKPLAGNQGTTILIENLFYNVSTRKKALASPSEEFSRISEVVTKYSIHNPSVGFTLKKQGESLPAVRTLHNSSKINNIKILYGSNITRDLLDIELEDESLQFKMHCLLTNPNYSNKRLTFILFINHRLVDSSPMRKMLEDLYSIYLPKKTHPWCYLSLNIHPGNIDVNVHPTKYEVRFLHEDTIIERVKAALDAQLSKSNSSRTFYVQARLPQVDITKDVLEKVLPEFDNDKKKVYAKEMIRTDATDQKLDKFNFTVTKSGEGNDSRERDIKFEGKNSGETREIKAEILESCQKTGNEDSKVIREKKVSSCMVMTPKKEFIVDFEAAGHAETSDCGEASVEGQNTPVNPNRLVNPHWSSLVDEATSGSSQEGPRVTDATAPLENNYDGGDVMPKEVLELLSSDAESSNDTPAPPDPNSSVADRALKAVLMCFGSQKSSDEDKLSQSEEPDRNKELENLNDSKNAEAEGDKTLISDKSEIEVPGGNAPGDSSVQTPSKTPPEFKSYSVNNTRREVRLTSILKLRKAVEDNYHEGLRNIISGMTFVGCIDETLALIQSDVNLYICNTAKLAEELFYEIMLYDFANYGVIKFSEPLPIYDLAMLGLETEEAGWDEGDGPKEGIASNVQALLMEKAEMLKEYFAMVIDKRGNLRSLPVLLQDYFPSQAEIPLFILRLSTEVEWSVEQTCFDNICREIAKFYSKVATDNLGQDWKHLTEHVIYDAVKESLLPPKHFSHDSTILQIASLPNLYKVFERC